MNPNLPTPPTTQPVAPQPSSRRNIIIISVLILIALLLGGIFYINYTKKSPQPPPQITKSTPVPTATSVSLKANQGTVSSITKDKILIASGSVTSEFTIDNLTVVGTKTKKVTLSDIKVGQEVSITTPEGSNSARLILILK